MRDIKKKKIIKHGHVAQNENQFQALFYLIKEGSMTAV